MSDKEFLSHVGLENEDVEAARLTVGELQRIYAHHQERSGDLLRAGEAIQSTLREVAAVHSTRVRVKTPVSLIRKIVRKCAENEERSINFDNYADDIRDIVGLRALHLFKEDWKPIHEEILTIWDLHPGDPSPLAYYRLGDSEELKQKFEEAGCQSQPKDAGYRSVHYVIVDRPNKRDVFTAEIQVRTIFEEAWSEIDHRVRYPDFTDDPLLNEYLLMFNRLVGNADEMGSFLLRLQTELHFQKAFKQGKEEEKILMEQELANLKETLDRVKGALQKTEKAKTISEAERQRLERELDRVPEVFRVRESLRRDYEQLFNETQRRMKALYGNPGGLGLGTGVYQQLVERQEARERQIKESLERLERLQKPPSLSSLGVPQKVSRQPSAKALPKGKKVAEASEGKPERGKGVELTEKGSEE